MSPWKVKKGSTEKGALTWAQRQVRYLVINFPLSLSLSSLDGEAC